MLKLPSGHTLKILPAKGQELVKPAMPVAKKPEVIELAGDEELGAKAASRPSSQFTTYRDPALSQSHKTIRSADGKVIIARQGQGQVLTASGQQVPQGMRQTLMTAHVENLPPHVFKQMYAGNC